MKTVGIKDLRSNLSKYIRLVKDGEDIFVTEHNRIVAEITRPKPRKETISIGFFLTLDKRVLDVAKKIINLY